MKLSSCLATIIITFLPFSLQQPVQKVESTNAAKPGLHDMILKTVHDTASYLGFGVKCQNGGHKTEENTCLCPKYFRGKECELKICINGGRLEKVTIPNVHHVCRCPFPQFISGGHCEKVQCDHGGILKTFQNNGTWNCDCNAASKHFNFYKGMFCEKFILSTGWIMALICIGVLLIVGFICSSNWFARSRHHHRHYTEHQSSRRRAPQQPQAQQHPSNRSTAVLVPGGGRRSRGQRSGSADDLISSERGAHRRTAAYPEGITQQYVVRLDTIPTFNPGMIGGVEPLTAPNNREQTPVGPPPSYDQAMSSMRIEPPEYTPTDRAKLNS